MDPSRLMNNWKHFVPVYGVFFWKNEHDEEMFDSPRNTRFSIYQAFTTLLLMSGLFYLLVVI